MKKISIILVTILAFASVKLQAQDSCTVCKPFPWEIGALAGVNQYFGDMHCSQAYASQNKFVGGIFARRHFNDYFALRPQVLFGKIAGADADSPTGQWDYRNLSFTSPFLEADLLAEIYPFRDRRYNCNGELRKGLAPYIFAGIGGVNTNPTVTQGGSATFPVNAADLAADRANLKKWGFVIPFGVGVNWNVGNRFVLGVEGGYRYAFTDYIDGISKAGNSSVNDGYFIANALASYRFGDKDSDKDGVVDKCDLCADVPGYKAFAGCPDSDGDGTPDNVDACPDLAGPMALQGCPDADGDGIADNNDACPTVAGSALLNGCPDADKDGIADKDDSCPDVFGVAALNGCPDSDGDGIADKDDKCPYEAGTAALNGCPDADGDGIADADDDCPYTKGTVANKGCPDAVVSSGGSYVVDPGYTMHGCNIPAADLLAIGNASKGITYYSGTNKIKPESYSYLQTICDIISSCPTAELYINAYNDGPNTSANIKAAKLRACAIYTYLMKKKCISKARMHYDGYGDEDPTSPYMNNMGVKSGTRVEFVLR